MCCMTLQGIKPCHHHEVYGRGKVPVCSALFSYAVQKDMEERKNVRIMGEDGGRKKKQETAK